jgi:hypothetical protein
MNKSSHYCKVCGLYHEAPPWGENGNTPSFELCECCGAEFGFDDYSTEGIAEYRRQWLNDGAKWLIPRWRLANWNLDEQLKNAAC